MKRKALAIVLTLIMLVGVLPMGAFAAPETDAEVPAEAETKAVTYTDTEGHWAQKSIDRWTEAKNPAGQTVLEGMGNNIFAPDDNLTRAQAMTIFSRLLNLVKTADISKVTDVASDAWYAQWIQKGYAYEIIKGTSDTTFSPDGDISREQFFSIFARAMGIPGADKLAEGKTFTDLDAVSPWFVEEGTVYAMINAGYLNGYPDGSLQPQASITRAEVAQVLANAIDINGYITTDGTYNLKDVTGMVVVLAKNVTLTGAYTGHIVSSCVDSTLYTTQVNPGSVRAAVNVAAKNVKVTNVGVANPPYTPANPYNPNGGNYVYVLQDNTNINPVTAIGGGGGGGGGDYYTVTLTLDPPFGANTLELKADRAVNLSDALQKLIADSQQASENVIQTALDRMKAETSHVGENHAYTVEVIKEDTDYIIKVTHPTEAVNLDTSMSAVGEAFSSNMEKAAGQLDEAEQSAWNDISAAFNPYDLFTDYKDGKNNDGSYFTSMKFLSASEYAGKLETVLGALDTLQKADTDKNFASELKSILADGTRTAGLNWTKYVDYTDAANAIQNSRLIRGSSSYAFVNVSDINSVNDAVEGILGVNIRNDALLQALVEAGLKENVIGDYSLSVTVK